MKLTWFGGTTIRIHIGGEILVADPQLVQPGVDTGELISGAGTRFSLSAVDARMSATDGAAWQSRNLPRLIDGEARIPVLLHRIGDHAVLVDAAGEPPLVLAAGDELHLGRWAGEAVVVLYGETAVQVGSALLDTSPPRLIALAADEAIVDRAIPALRERLQGTGLVALEPGMAVEI